MGLTNKGKNDFDFHPGSVDLEQATGLTQSVGLTPFPRDSLGPVFLW